MGTTTQTETKSSKKKSNGKPRRNEMGGFYVEKIDGDLMRKYIKKNKLKDIDTDVTDEQLGVALALHFKSTVGKEDQVRCDTCDAMSSATEESCPFCGDGSEVEDDEASTASDDVDDKVEGGEHEDIEPSAEDETETSSLARDVEIAEPKKGKKKKAAAEKAAAAATNGSSTKSSTALATTATAHVVTVKDLDTKIVEVEQLSHEIAKSTYEGAEAYWRLGRVLLDINANHLWKLRTTPEGKTKYKSWDAFVHAELKMSPQHSYAAIDVAKGYDTPAEVVAIGQTKAALLLKAAPEDRPALTEAAKGGATVREITEGVQASRKKNGAPKTGKHAKAGSKGGASKAKTSAARSEKVSVTAFEGTTTIKLYKRPASIRNVDLGTLSRAKRLADQPFGRHEMANGLVQLFTVITKESGELVLKVETRRDEEA